MQKKSGLLLGVILGIILINLASAQFYGDYGRGFSIIGLIDSIGPDNLVFMASFIVFFAVIFYSLGKVFKDSYGYPNKPIAGTISFVISAAASYGLYQSGFDLTGLFYELGIDEGVLYPVISVIFLIVVIWIIWFLGRRKEFGRTTFSLKRGLGALFILSGLALILLTIFTDIFYEKFTAGGIGFVLAVIGFLLLRRLRKRTRYDDYDSSPRGPRGGEGKKRGIQKDIINAIRENKRKQYEREQKDSMNKTTYEEIAFLRKEIYNLKKMLPNASDIEERGRIERKIKDLEKEMKRLRKRIR